jgi:arabinofuranan 3-O-arabinosyltransferase
LVVAAVVFFGWFRTGYFYAEGDVAPFVRDGLRSEVGSQWTHQASGAGGATYEVARSPELVFIGLARLLGGTEALGQRLFFTAILAFAACSVAAMASVFCRRAWVVAIAGIVGAFNPFVMVSLPNPLPPLAIGFAGCLGAIACHAAIGGRQRWLLAAGLSLPLSYLVINPPLLAMTVAWAVALLVLAPLLVRTGTGGVRAVSTLYGRALALALPLSLWWIVPSWFAFTRATSSGTIHAETEVLAWAWTHRNATIPATAALLGRWSWPDPAYHAGTWLAYAPWSWALWVLPASVVAAPFLARPRWRRTAGWLLAGTAVLVFVGKGVHPPLDAVNLWLYQHVPGFFLLREPLSKVGALLVPIELTAWAMTLDGLAARWAPASGSGGRRRTAARAAVALLIAGPAIAAVPMLSGEVVRSEPVAIPVQWQHVADYVNTSPARGKALVLPLVDYYQIPTTWGYYGTDDIGQLLTRPVITLNPQAYIGDTPTYSRLVREVEEALVAGEADTVANLLRVLGVSHVIVRKDIDYESAIRQLEMQRPEAITATMTTVPDFKTVIDTTVADVWEVASPSADPVRLLGGLVTAGPVTDDKLVPLIGSTPDNLAVVSEVGTTLANDLIRGRARTVLPGDDASVKLDPGTWQAARHTSGEGLYHVDLETAANGSRTFVLRDAVTWRIGGQALSDRPEITVPAPSRRVVGVAVDEVQYDLTSGSTTVRLNSASTLRAIMARPARTTAFGPLGDCNRHDDQTPEQVGLGASLDGTVPYERIELRADDHAACVSASVAAAPGDELLVEVPMRSVAGAAPRTCLWLDGPDMCAALTEPPLATGRWATLRASYTVPAGVDAVTLYLYADAPSPDTTTTITQYRAPQVSLLRAADPVPVPVGAPPPSRIYLGKTAAEIRTRVALPPVSIGAASDVGNCHRQEPVTLEEVGITATPIDDGVRLHADRHSACVTFPLTGMLPGTRYQVSLRYRVVEGAEAPRACLVDTDGRCQPVGPLPSSAAWTQVQVRSQIPAGTSGTGTSLYLYADANLGAATIDYTDIRIEPASGESLVLATADAEADPVPDLTWTQEGPARYRAHIDDASGPFVLALSDSWSPDWVVKGLPDNAKVAQLRLDGYRNGWAVDATGDLDLVVEYQPARWGRLAFVASATTAAGTVLAVTVAGIRRLRPRRRHRSRRPSAVPAPSAADRS